jgi:tetratricopeptide (TPR) repeat protein/S1-C subfamily serine protease
MKKLLFTTVFLTSSLLITSLPSAYSTPVPTLAQQGDDGSLLTPQLVQQTAKSITVRITSENNGGSGVIIAKKGDTYLILTNAHVVNRSNSIAIQAPDGQKYQAKSIDGGFNSKYDLALLQFTSKNKYTLANLKNLAGTPIEPTRKIYSSGFPFDSKDIRITSGEVSQLTDIPFDDGTQIGYVTKKGEKGIRQGMSGGAIFDIQGNFLGINTVGIAPIVPNYTYNDGSKPIPKLAAQYTRANWGIPVYNFLTHVKAEILYGYDNLPKVLHQVTPTGYMAKLNDKVRKMTVRIEGGGGNGSGVIVAQQGNTYYVLTAKHVIRREPSKAEPKPAVFDDIKTVTVDQESYAIQPSDITLAEGLDLAIVKFTSNNKYPIATLGDYTQQSQNEIAFVGGFPARERIDSQLWQWQLNPGQIFIKGSGQFVTQDKSSFSNGGYNLVYTSISYAGMSGGPVFDTNGNVIGIHGKAEGESEKLILGNSLGISIQNFIGIASELKVNPQFLKIDRNIVKPLNASDLATVLAAKNNIPQPQVDGSAEQWLQYGNQLYRTEKYAEAVNAFDRAILIRKEYKIQGSYGKALAFTAQGKYDIALSAISTAISAIPMESRQKYYYLWKYQSSIFSNLKKYDDAIRSIDLAILFEPNDRILKYKKAIILGFVNRRKEAIEIYNELLIIEPEVYLYTMRGMEKFSYGDPQGGMDDFALAIKLDPNDAHGYSMRYLVAKVAKFNRDPQADIDDLTQLIRLNPYDPSWCNSRGLVKLKLGDKKGAILDFDKSIAIEPNVYAYYNRGNAKSDLGDNQEAIKDYDRAIAINPKYIDAYVNRGLAKSDLGNKQDAIVDYDRAIAINPKYALAYNNRGFAKYELGNKQEAIVDYDRAIAINPKYAKAYYNRSNAKSDLGNKQGAIIDMSKAVELYREKGQTESYKDAIGKLEKLKRQ